MAGIPISVTILTKNSAKYLDQVLESVKYFDEVVIYDTGSTDQTIEIARRYSNTRVFCESFIGFGPTHNKASNVAKNEWVLSLDSDEIVTPEMRNEICNLILADKTVYSFPRDNYFNGKWIKWCGWYPDRQFRLYNRTETRFTAAQVHESVIVDGMKHIPLKGSIIHYSYADIAEFLAKMQSYSDLFAKQNCGKKTSSPSKAVLHGLFAFFKSYFIKKGFMGGYEGFVVSTYNANTAFYKYLKLYEANQRINNKDVHDGQDK